MRHVFFCVSFAVFALIGFVGWLWSPALWSLAVAVPVFLLGVRDATQRRRSVLRNFPVIGHFRYLFEMIRPEINQYFVESNTDGRPFSRELRSVAYQRAKGVTESIPFGTQRDVYAPGYEWLDHSFMARTVSGDAPRVRIGGPLCTAPYEASLLNVSAMSYGSLSENAVQALSGGAQRGGFYLNTGEGGISPHHRAGGADLVWQIGTAYFGCRDEAGNFSPDKFEELAWDPQVKMIEVKLSQGAKPGHGGFLPGAKVAPDIAEIRGVPVGQDIASPPRHATFDSPRELLQFLHRLRELSGGKPVGFKLCVGHRSEFLGICKAIHSTGLYPDFITVDGGEGGTGAAPFEFSNSLGCPLTEAIVFVHNALTGFGIRDQIKIIASGGIVTGFHIARRLAAGADLCNSARAFMFSLGCIQALRCNSNDCPVGIATQNPRLVKGLDIENKMARVTSFHERTVRAFRKMIAAAGLDAPDQLLPSHIHRRVSQTEVATYEEIYDYLEPMSLLGDAVPDSWRLPLALSSMDAFRADRYDEAMPPPGGEVFEDEVEAPESEVLATSDS